MVLVDRLKNILVSPKTEWPAIAAEPMTAQDVYTRWVMILGAIGPLALLASTGSLRFAIAQYLIVLAMTAIIALVIDAIAPKFGGTKDFVASLKLAAFSHTPAFVAGIFHVLGGWGWPLILLGAVYAWYTFYLGAPVLGKSSSDKAIVFTIVIVAIGFVLGLVLGRIGAP